MADHVLIDGDVAVFSPTFGTATVAVRPGTLRATGPATLGGKRLCVAGDEKSVSVAGCSYVTPSHPLPGTGTLEIAALARDQTAATPSTGGAPVLLVGSRFTAAFVVQDPAKQPSAGGPIPDPLPRYSGSGTFETANAKLRGA